MPDHLVWPEGPPCDPSCPGEWSQYHDGYSWGYEKGTAALDAALARERRLREAMQRADETMACMWSYREEQRDGLGHTCVVQASDVIRAALAETPEAGS